MPKLPLWIRRPRLALRNSLNEKYPPPTLPIAKVKPAAPAKRAVSKPRHYARVAPGNAHSVTLARIKHFFEMAHIRHFESNEDRWAPTVHIAQDEVGLLATALKLWFEDQPSVRFRLPLAGYVAAKNLTADLLKKEKYFDILCVEQTHEGAGETVLAVSMIQVALWRNEVTAVGEPLAVCGKPNPYFTRLRRHAFDALANGSMAIPTHPPLRAATFDIDVVYTWVDDQDQDWRDEKATYLPPEKRDAFSANRAHHDERFRNRDELKYSLRSLEMFAPFVRNIYIVTAGQTPSWLNVDHPQITMVSHSEIYKDQGALPTYNSSGIETQLHHIDGLAEHFLYFNDDFFLGKFCHPEDFFSGNGMMLYFPSEQRVFDPDIDNDREEYLIADANITKLMRRDLGKFGAELMIHAPYASRRSFLYQLEKRYPDAFDTCAEQRFRSPLDIRPIAFAQYHFGYAEAMAFPAAISNRYLSLWRPKVDQLLFDLLAKRNYKTFCLNDVGVQPDKSAWTDKVVGDFLERYFPFKSKFEL